MTLNILTDFLFAVVIPVPMLWNLNVNRRTRASLILALGLGCFACGAAIAKIPSIVNYGKTGDWLWDSRDMCIWTVVECNVGIIAGSIPALRPLFKSVLGSTLGGSGKATNGSGYIRQGSNAMNSRRSAFKSANKSVSDETSSERGFNDASYFEMGNRGADKKPTTTANVFADVDALSSDETVNRVAPHGADSRMAANGITKTVTASVRFGEKA